MTLMDARNPRQLSFLAFLVLGSSVVFVGLLSMVPSFPWSEVFLVLPALAIILGFFIAARIKCSHCGARLVESYPFKGGGAILL